MWKTTKNNLRTKTNVRRFSLKLFLNINDTFVFWCNSHFQPPMRTIFGHFVNFLFDFRIYIQFASSHIKTQEYSYWLEKRYKLQAAFPLLFLHDVKVEIFFWKCCVEFVGLKSTRFLSTWYLTLLVQVTIDRDLSVCWFSSSMLTFKKTFSAGTWKMGG